MYVTLTFSYVSLADIVHVISGLVRFGYVVLCNHPINVCSCKYIFNQSISRSLRLSRRTLAAPNLTETAQEILNPKGL